MCGSSQAPWWPGGRYRVAVVEGPAEGGDTEAAGAETAEGGEPRSGVDSSVEIIRILAGFFLENWVIHGVPSARATGLTLMGVPPSYPACAKFLSAESGRQWNTQNLSHHNPGARADGTPCIFSRFLATIVKIQAYKKIQNPRNRLTNPSRVCVVKDEADVVALLLFHRLGNDPRLRGQRTRRVALRPRGHHCIFL